MRLWPWLLMAPWAVWTAVRLAGVDSWYPAAQLIAFTPYVAAASMIPVLATLAARRWAAAVFAVLLAATLATCVLPRWKADPDRLPETSGPTLTVMTANLLKGQADPSELVRLVRDNHVDLLMLQELTPQAIAAADAAGLATLLPHRVLYPIDGTEGSGVLSAFPLSGGGVRINPGGFRQAHAELLLPGGISVLIESAHPFSPYAKDMVPLWRDSLAGQPRATVDGPLRILAGDFNATLDHALLRDLIDSGYRDAAAVAGIGLTGTWGPYDGDAIPPVVIDHVLADRRIGVRDVAVLDLPGSDHRPVLAQLVLPANLGE